jgi:hypothetical protein
MKRGAASERNNIIAGVRKELEAQRAAQQRELRREKKRAAAYKAKATAAHERDKSSKSALHQMQLAATADGAGF